MSFIEVCSLEKKYGSYSAVSDISFNIEKGELFGLLGPNGAGKSTTISMISALIKPTTGNIKVDGIDICKKPREARKYIGLVPQDIALYPTLSAEENLKFWGKMYDIRGTQLKEQVNTVLKIVNLEEKRKSRIETFSGGMKRRINIAAALIHNPEIIIMDEPTVGIDPQSRNHILETVKELNKKGVTVIYTSHYMEEVEFLCNKVAIMDKGKIIAMDEKEALKRSIVNTERLEMRVSKMTDDLQNEVKNIAKKKNAESIIEDNTIIINTDNASTVLADLMAVIIKFNAKVLQTKIEEPNLESVFLSLTGKELRD